MAERCEGCGHAAHRDMCRGKAKSGCVPLANPDGTVAGIACYGRTRPPCPCPFGWCHHCRAPVTGATVAGRDDEVDIERDSANRPGGTWAVRKLADATLAARLLGDGEEPGPGEWRGTEHHCLKN